MKKKQEWIAEIESDISRLKAAGRKTLYLISAEMDTKTANGVIGYFTKQGYVLEVRKCNSCNNSYDIIMSWENLQ